MKIVSLKAENFLRLIAVEISPSGETVLITGKNGAGKSSVLDAIVVALCGKKYLPKKPIRDGQDSAEIIIETEELIVTRKITQEQSYVKVTNKQGHVIPSPQAFLWTRSTQRSSLKSLWRSLWP
jgi:DNA repair exonuclease SbcCD ATPase subunit